MKHKKTHIIPTLKEIYDYIFRRKSNGSRHELERKMQQDPFVEEAMEGFSLVDESRAKKDISSLNERIHGSAHRTPVYWYAGIAATVALLIIAGVGLLLLEQSQKSMRESQLSISEPTEPREDSLTADESVSEAEELARETTEPAATITSRQRESQIIKPKDSATSTPDWEDTEEFIVSEYEIPDLALHEIDTKPLIPPLPLNTEIALAEEMQRTSGAVAKVAETPMIVLPDLDMPSPESTHQKLRGQVVDAVDWKPLPGVTITVKGTTLGTVTNLEGRFELEVPRDEEVKILASFIGMQTLELDAAELVQDNVLALESDMASLSEVVVIGYGTSVKSGHEQDLHADDKMNRRDYSPPTPRDGYPAYRQYLRENALLDQSDERNRALVVISFTINPSGSPENFEISRSPGEQYSQKAVDLIISGPGWQPARLGSRNIEETVRFRIVFRKNTD